jgi:hypothetical protein
VRLARVFAMWMGLAVAFAGARAAHVVDDSCVQACDDDDDDGHCPPDCGDCSCCTHPAPVMPAVGRLGIVRAVPRPRRLPPAESLPASADPHEVFHIPKLARV